jgi:MFS transporter, NNP family, nitrate/nitrite transporter
LALEAYLAFYVICLALTWWFYLRRTSTAAGTVNLAEARV